MNNRDAWRAALASDSRRHDSPGYFHTLMIPPEGVPAEGWFYYNWPSLVVLAIPVSLAACAIWMWMAS